MKKIFYLINDNIFLSEPTPLNQVVFWLIMTIIVATMLEILKYYLYKLSDERTKEKVLSMFERKNVFKEFMVNKQPLKKVPESFIKEQHKLINIYDNCKYFAELLNNESIHVIVKSNFDVIVYNNIIYDYKLFLTLFIPANEINQKNKNSR